MDKRISFVEIKKRSVQPPLLNVPLANNISLKWVFLQFMTTDVPSVRLQYLRTLHHYCIIIISLFVRHHWIILCKKCKLFLNIFSVKYSNITVTSNTLNSIKIIQMYVVIHLVT